LSSSVTRIAQKSSQFRRHFVQLCIDFFGDIPRSLLLLLSLCELFFATLHFCPSWTSSRWTWMHLDVGNAHFAASPPLVIGNNLSFLDIWRIFE
jgi:hypothetical protein